MKTIKFFAAAILTLGTLSSCKKETTQPPADNSPKMSKIEKTDGGYTMRFAYDAQDRLIQAKDNSFTILYDYSSGSLKYTILDESGIKAYDLDNLSIVNGKATAYTYRGFNASGDVISSSPTTAQYDANGFQVQNSYWSYNYITEIAGANMIKLTEYVNGNLDNVTTYEYYMDKPSKFNVNVFENRAFNHILCDKGTFGKQNANLLKKLTNVDGGTTKVYEYSYVTDANGLVTEYTVTRSVNGGASTAETFNVSWQ